MNNKPIGLLDSGAGGLTVLKAVKDRLPNESFVYIGDAARCPYGNRTNEEIIAFTLEMAYFLVKQDVKLIVIACNTATAQALEIVKEDVPVPVIGVISPGSEAAVKSSVTKNIGILATKSTVESNFYTQTINELSEDVVISQLACPSFVEMVESNTYKSTQAKEAVIAHLTPFKKDEIDTLVLGCTHFPLLSPFIQEAMGEEVTLIDPGVLTSKKTEGILRSKDLLADSDSESTIQLFTTDESVELFKRIATDWMGTDAFDIQTVSLERVEKENE